MRLATVASEGVDLLVLPEMAVTGYVFPDLDAVRAVAEPQDGPTFTALSEVAARSGSWIVCGFPERDGDRVFNSALVIDPSGQRAFTYRKTLLYSADLPWATPGDSGYRRFDTAHGSFGVGICMDLNDDRFVDWCAREAVDVVAMPTNWIDEDQDVWPYWAMRLYPLKATLVAANTWGAEADTRFSGASAVLTRDRLLAGAPKRGDGFITATLPAASGAPGGR